MHEGKQKGHEDACWMLLQPKEMDFVYERCQKQLD